MKRILMLCILVVCLLCVGCGIGSQDLSDGTGDYTAEKKIFISEAMSRNSYFSQLSDGNFYDWIELYNASDDTVDLKGYSLSDDDRRLRKWVVSESFIIQPGDYIVIYLSGLDCIDTDGNLHASFRLSSSGETLIFSDDAGMLVTTFDMPECPAENIARGIQPGISPSSPDAQYVWLAQPTPGEANLGNFSKDVSTLEYPTLGVVINEYMSSNKGVLFDCDGECSDWVELFNPTESAIDLTACALSDSSDGNSRWFFPDNTIIGPGEYLIVFCSGKLKGYDCAELHADFRLGAEDSVIQLYSIIGHPAEFIEYHSLPDNVSCGRDPQTGELRLYSKPTPGRANTTYSYDLTATVFADLSEGIYISETMSVSNSSSRSYGQDFIELHNSTPSTVSLEGYKLSSGDGEVCFQFPAVEVGAGGYIIVYCNGTESTSVSGELTAPFKLNRSGEYIFLYDTSGICVDMINTGKQSYGCSRGRIEGNMQEQFIFETPTPGKANTTARYIGYAPEPLITTSEGKEGGYVSTGTQIVIHAPDGCTVHYTVTGEDPTVSSEKYSSPFIVNETTTVKAIAIKPDHQPSDVAVSSFITSEPHEIPVVMISGLAHELFSADAGILSGNIGGLLDDRENYYAEVERKISLEYYVDGLKAFDFQCGLKVFGETSRQLRQKGLAVYLREWYDSNTIDFPIFEDYDITTFGGFLLRPSGQDFREAHMRDELCALISKNRFEAEYMEVQPVALYINGAYYGLYYIREKYNEDYLVNHYGANPDDVDIVKWQGDSQAGSAADYIALTKYVMANDMSNNENYEYFCEQVDIDSLIDYWIAETFFANRDSGNIRCYRIGEDGKWRWMLFDLDASMLYGAWKTDYIYEHCLDPNGHGDSNVLDNDIPRKLFDSEAFTRRFIERYCYHLQTTFAPDRTIDIFEKLYAKIESEMPRQAERWGAPSTTSWPGNCELLRNFLIKRPEQIRIQLMENFDLSERELNKIMKQTTDGID